MAQGRAFRILDPVAAIAAAAERRPRKLLETLVGIRIGFVWGQHVSSVVFWPLFERAVEAMYSPSSTTKLYKTSTWNPASRETLDDLLPQVDVVIAGVGG